MNKTLSNVATACGNCGTGIDPHSQFCAGCGQPIWQNCECGASVLLTQSFCNGCGTNLDEKLQARLDGFERLFARCQQLRNDGKYDDAKHLVEPACKHSDYRFKQVSNQAQQLLVQIGEEQERWAAEVDNARSKMERYLATDRLDDIVRVLSQIPTGMLPAELNCLLRECAAKCASEQRCKAELRVALAEGQCDRALSCMLQLAELHPTEAKYQKRIAQLVDKVVQKAMRYHQKSRFSKAVELLQSIPASFIGPQALGLMHGCEEAVFLQKLLARSTYVNPLLRAAIDKLERYRLDEAAIAPLQKRFRESQLAHSKLKRSVWVQWTEPETAILGVPVVPTRIPNAFAGVRPDCIASMGSQFFVAIGLAVQAARSPMPRGELQEKKRTGVLGFLATRKPAFAESGWGVDIGESSIKAVQLRYSGDACQPRIEQATMIKLDTRASSTRKVNRAAMEAGIQQLLAEVQFGNQRVVVNFAGSDLVSRYFLLPPNIDPKRFDEFVLQEARANIPISVDLLQTAYKVSDSGGSDSLSPSVALVAARKQEVEFRRALLEKSGLRLDGFLPEPFALWNSLQAIDAVDTSALAGGDNAAVMGDEQGQGWAADMMIDVGLHRTSLLISHARGMWHRTLDWGTQDLTAAVAKAMQLTQVDADLIRRDSQRAERIQIPVVAMQTAAQTPRREIQRSLKVAQEAIGAFRLRRVILVGGGASQPFLSDWLSGRTF